MRFSRKEYKKYRSDIKKWLNAKPIFLPPDEYAKVMSEFNTHMSDEDRKHRLVTKPIGDNYYTIINNGFDDYIIIGKRPIINDIEKEWENIQ